MDLHALLETLNVSKPFVLLGMSLSGLVAQLYACEHPTETAALILLDPTPEHTFEDFMKYPQDLQLRIRSTMLQGTKQMGEGLFLESQMLPESCEQVRIAVEDQRRLPDIPVVVLTACEPTTFGENRRAAGRALIPAHKRIAERTSRGRHVLVEGATHMTMSRGEPHEFIVKTVESVVTEVFGER